MQKNTLDQILVTRFSHRFCDQLTEMSSKHDGKKIST